MNKVLIIEADTLIAELERDYLEADGLETEIEQDGARGLNKALGDQYGAVILDMVLLGMNGSDVYRELKKKKNIPVIMVTAKKEEVDWFAEAGYGADHCLLKPFRPTELVSLVRESISRGEMTENVEVLK